MNIYLSTFSGFFDLFGSHVNGDVLASAAKISGSLTFAAGSSRTWWSRSSLLDLRGASVGDIEDDPAAWPPHLLLGGFCYSVLAGDQEEEAVVKQRIVLDRRTIALLDKATVGYGYQPQRAIYAAVLFIIIGALVARKLPATGQRRRRKSC